MARSRSSPPGQAVSRTSKVFMCRTSSGSRRSQAMGPSAVALAPARSMASRTTPCPSSPRYIQTIEWNTTVTNPPRRAFQRGGSHSLGGRGVQLDGRPPGYFHRSLEHAQAPGLARPQEGEQCQASVLRGGVEGSRVGACPHGDLDGYIERGVPVREDVLEAHGRAGVAPTGPARLVAVLVPPQVQPSRGPDLQESKWQAEPAGDHEEAAEERGLPASLVCPGRDRRSRISWPRSSTSARKLGQAPSGGPAPPEVG